MRARPGPAWHDGPGADVDPAELAAHQETVAGLNAVVMLGSFLHSAPDVEATAELAAGGLAAITGLPLAMVVWYPDGDAGPIAVCGRWPGGAQGRGGGSGATALRGLCGRWDTLTPTWTAGTQVPPALRESGVETLLAVPLRVSTEALGFLVAGGEARAMPADLMLVHALGTQTATALYVARLHAAEERRVRELGALAAELREQGELLSRALALQEELIDLVLRGKDAGAIVTHLAGRIGAPVWLLDADRGVLAHAAGGAAEPAAPRECELARVLDGHRRDHDPRRLELATDVGVRPFLLQCVAVDRETFGHLMVGATELGAVDRTTFQGGRLVLALRLLIERSVAEAEERLGRDLVRDAVRGHGDGGVPAALAARLGHRGDGPAAVVVLRPGDPGDPARATRRVLAAARSELSCGGVGLAGTLDRDVVLILRPEALERVTRRLLDRVREALPGADPAVGISDPRPGLGELEPAHREALTAVGLATRAPRRVLRFAELGLTRLLFDAGHTDRVEAHVEHWLGPLRRYDADHGTAMVETLAAVLDEESHAATAQRLTIHASTLKYRLRRIREILDLDFTEPEARFNLALALRLAASLRTLGGS